MAAPLLAVDLPSMLYRAFYALPDSIKGADGKPVNALLGAANLILQEVGEHEPRAVVLCMGPDAAEYRVELYAGYHAAAARDARGPGRPVGRRARLLRGVRLDGRRPRLARGRRPARLLRPGRVEGRRHGAADDRRPRHVPVRLEGVTVLYVSTGKKVARRSTRRRSSAATASAPEQVPDFIALRGDPSDGLPGAKGVGEKTAAELLRKHGSLEGVLEAAIAETRPKLRTALLGSRDELLAFKEIATLQDAKVKRPARPRTDREGAGEGGARARDEPAGRPARSVHRRRGRLGAMAIEGRASAEIEAPIAEVFAVAADVEGSPRWQPEIKRAEVLERDADGRQMLVRTETDAKVRTLNSTLRFGYDEPDRDQLGADRGRPEVGPRQLGARGPRRRPDPGHLLDGGRPRADARDGDPRSAGRRAARARWSRACPAS